MSKRKADEIEVVKSTCVTDNSDQQSFKEFVQGGSFVGGEYVPNSDGEIDQQSFKEFVQGGSFVGDKYVPNSVGKSDEDEGSSGAAASAAKGDKSDEDDVANSGAASAALSRCFKVASAVTKKAHLLKDILPGSSIVAGSPEELFKIIEKQREKSEAAQKRLIAKRRSDAAAAKAKSRKKGGIQADEWAKVRSPKKLSQVVKDKEEKSFPSWDSYLNYHDPERRWGKAEKKRRRLRFSSKKGAGAGGDGAGAGRVKKKQKQSKN